MPTFRLRPVTFRLKDFDGNVKVLTASMFWVETSNELVNSLKKQFSDRLDIDVRSMDSQEKREETAAV